MCEGGGPTQSGASYDRGESPDGPVLNFGSASVSNDPTGTGGARFNEGAMPAIGGYGGGVGSGNTAITGGGSGFDNLPGLGNPDFSYLNASGVQSFGGEVPGYGATALGGDTGIPGVSSAGGSSPGVNVLSGGPTGQSAVPGQPGGSGTDLTATQPKVGAAGGKPESESILSSLGVKNPLGAAVGAAGLGYAMTQGQKAPKFSPEMESAARNLDANGRQLMSYLQSGNLPPGLKAGLDQATSAAKAKIVSNFASQGLSTDPTQNSVLAQQLAQVDQQAIISTAQIGQQLMASGLAESGLSSDLYKTLANIDATQTANIGKAIASFASSLSGGGGGINLKVA